MPDICNGCGGPPAIDHYHRWVNTRSEIRACWCIDGKVFDDILRATGYIIETLQSTGTEALTFIKTIPHMYNTKET